MGAGAGGLEKLKCIYFSSHIRVHVDVHIRRDPIKHPPHATNCPYTLVWHLRFIEARHEARARGVNAPGAQRVSTHSIRLYYGFTTSLQGPLYILLYKALHMRYGNNNHAQSVTFSN